MWESLTHGALNSSRGLLLLLASCKEVTTMTLELTCTAFRNGDAIPKPYTADGQDISPPLKWADPPSGTRSLTVICEDPDAPRGTFTHWLLFNLPADARELSDNIPNEKTLPNGVRQGANDFGKIGYVGPSPPPGKPHRYFFKLYALNQMLDLPAGSTKDQLKGAMKGHVLAEGDLLGIYGR
jgi:Raf kinase inhibitor-like YbhB/YbcL family protein